MNHSLIEFVGEYGPELGVFIPFVNYLKTNGMLVGKKVKTYSGMRPYYFFLSDDEYEEKDITDKRRWVPPELRNFLPDNLKDDDRVYKLSVKPFLYDPPDYYTHYKSQYIKSTKPIFIIQNKYNMEWGHPPLNFFDTTQLDSIITVLSRKFTVVYFRTNSFTNGKIGYSTDHNEAESYTLDDKEMIKKKWQNKDVLLIEDMVESLGIDFNTLKLILLSNSKYTLSTFGGINFSDAYFPSKHLIYIGWIPEQFDKEFLQNMHDLLCTKCDEKGSSDIFYTNNFDSLLEELSKC